MKISELSFELNRTTSYAVKFNDLLSFVYINSVYKFCIKDNGTNE